jgi:hypothetical protein
MKHIRWFLCNRCVVYLFFVFVLFYIVCPSILKTGQNKYLKNFNILGFNSTYLIKLHLTPFKTYQKSLLLKLKIEKHESY